MPGQFGEMSFQGISGHLNQTYRTTYQRQSLHMVKTVEAMFIRGRGRVRRTDYIYNE